MPAGWDKELHTNATVTADGRSIDIVYPMDPERHASLRGIHTERARHRQSRTELEVRRINALPFEAHKELIERHLAAVAAIHAARTLPPEERADALRRASTDTISDPATSHRTRFTVTAQ